MRLVILSDTHCWNTSIEVPDGDVLIHAGDFTFSGESREIQPALNWLGSLPHKVKLIIFGNHDFLAQDSPRMVRDICTEQNLTWLQDSGIEIDSINFWGSAITPLFGSWAFMEERGNKIRRHWNLIPENTNVLITHGPPINILDETPRHQHVGCFDLYEQIKKLPKLTTHIFGHIHYDGGKIVEKHGVKFINASVVDEDYELVRNPIVIDI